MVNIKTYLINLDDSGQRLFNVKQELKNAGLDFERVSAFDGRFIDPLSVEGYDDQAAHKLMGRGLTGGEIGCYKSHLKCAERFLKTDAKYALVLEDDISLESEFRSIFLEAVNWLDRRLSYDWHLLHLAPGNSKFHTPILNLENGGQRFLLAKSHYYPVSTSAIVWSRLGAKYFIENRQKMFLAVDEIIREDMIYQGKGLMITPPIAFQTGADSDIDFNSCRKVGHKSLTLRFYKNFRNLKLKLYAFYFKIVSFLRYNFKSIAFTE